MDDLIGAIVGIGVIALLVVGGAIVYTEGWDDAVADEQRKAVEAGVATYEVIDSAGNVDFRFLTKEEVCK